MIKRKKHLEPLLLVLFLQPWDNFSKLPMLAEDVCPRCGFGRRHGSKAFRDFAFGSCQKLKLPFWGIRKTAVLLSILANMGSPGYGLGTHSPFQVTHEGFWRTPCATRSCTLALQAAS